MVKSNLLLLHGAIGSSDQLIPLATFLDKNYKTHLLNFSGHGGKSFGIEFNISQFVNDVIIFLDENGIDKIDVFGYSMGGYVALCLAKKHPERIGKIITLGTKLKWTREIAIAEMKMLNAEKIVEKIPKFANVLKERHAPNDWKIVLDKTAQMMLEMGVENPLNLTDYKSINHTVKLGLAANDEMASVEETVEVQNALPNAEFYQIDNSYHPIEKVDIAVLANEITEFLC